MLGPDLLVAPVLAEGATTREVYLPAHPGGWYDWHGGTVFEGGRTITVAAPLGRLPVFARAGSIVPIEDEKGLTLIAFGAPDHGGSSLVYVDDGETSDWRNSGRTIELRLRPDDIGFVLDVSGGELAAPIRVRGVGVPNLRLAGTAE
jgi:alpha-glucosidase